jgi:hypothetical protein
VVEVTDAPLVEAEALVVTARVGPRELSCASKVVQGSGVSCGEVDVSPTEGGYTVRAATRGDEEDAPVHLTIERGGVTVFDGPVPVNWSEPFYPNGKRCGSVCVSASGAIEVAPGA